jgi:hypothetical protein
LAINDGGGARFITQRSQDLTVVNVTTRNCVRSLENIKKVPCDNGSLYKRDGSGIFDAHIAQPDESPKRFPFLSDFAKRREQVDRE